MYATLSFKRLVTLLLLPPLFAFAAYSALEGAPQNLHDAWVLAGKIVGWWTIFITVVGGSASRFAPWRIAWWLIPQLNRWVFPDLNGKWDGTTSSNWPVIKAMYELYEQEDGAKRQGSLSDIPLQTNALTVAIKASFFRIRVEAKLSSSDGSSYSEAARVSYNDALDRFELNYVYTQQTPEPKITDEAAHAGAARLVVDLSSWTMRGEYWTMRSWRSGLNTAGIIALKRVSRR